MNFIGSLRMTFVRWPALLALLIAPAVHAQVTNQRVIPPPPPPKQVTPPVKKPAPGQKTTTPNTQRGGTQSTQQSRSGTSTTTNGRGANSSTANRGGTSSTSRGTAATNNGRSSSNTSGRRGTSNTSAGRGSSTTSTAHGPFTTRAVQTRGGAANVTSDPNGRVTSIHTQRGMTIDLGMHGGRVIETKLPGGGRLVSVGPARGFVEHPIAGRPGFVQRTYSANGNTFVRVYRTASYQGISYTRYIPGNYFAPRFYGWTQNPWPGRVVYAWGWNSPPWFFGGYFAPAPYYPTASLWLADFMLAGNLQISFDSQSESAAEANGHPISFRGGASPIPSGQIPLSADARQAVANELQRQLVAEGAASANPMQANSTSGHDLLPPALSPADRIFVVTSTLNLSDGKNPCGLTPGDVVSRMDDAPDSEKSVRVIVLASKAADCGQGSTPKIEVAFLQDIKNDMVAQMDSALRALSSNQGQKGLPSAPDATPIPNKEGSGAPDLGVDSKLRTQRQDADNTEKDVRQSSQAKPNALNRQMEGNRSKAYVASQRKESRENRRLETASYFCSSCLRTSASTTGRRISFVITSSTCGCIRSTTRETISSICCAFRMAGAATESDSAGLG
jgi:hypothetical protein